MALLYPAFGDIVSELPLFRKSYAPSTELPKDLDRLLYRICNSGDLRNKLDLIKTMLLCGVSAVGCYLLASLASLAILGLLGCALCGLAVGIM